MQNLSNISVVKDVMSRHGVQFSKALGQNFIINPTVCPRMAEMGNAAPGNGIIEIGPGIGVLSAELAKRADKVICIEIDKRLIPVLGETLAEYPNVSVINQDVLKVDLKRLIEEEFAGMQVSICANLPYYITSPIIMQILESKLPIRSVTVMVQKEAAERICAEPGTRDSGAISLAVRYYCNPKILFQVSRGSFMPPPDVDSTVIRLDVLQEPPVAVTDEKKFFSLIRAGFSQRRKTLVNSVSSSIAIPKADLQQALEQLRLVPTVRPEQLTLQNFADLYNLICDFI